METEAQLGIEIGAMKFNAGGSQAWVDAKYEGFLALVKEMDTHPARPAKVRVNEDGEPGDTTVSEVGPLAIFLKTKSVGANQNKRFLAAAVWLKRQGQSNIKTAAVVKALADAQQQRLGNPADILNQNVKKGFCVKIGDGFYVTPEGEESLTAAS